MQLKPRLLALALGSALAPFSALAQDIELVTESPIIFQITFGTSITTQNGQTGTARVDTTRAYTSVLPHKDIIRSLLGLSSADNVDGWDLVAVRDIAADLTDLNTSFDLFLVNAAQNIRTRVPSNRFGIGSNASVLNSTTTHSIRNIISGNGTFIENTALQFLSGFVRRETAAVITGPFTENVGGQNRTYNIHTKTDATFTLDYMSSNGFSTVSFNTRSYNEPVFFFPIDSIRYNGRGDFTGTFLNTEVQTKKFTTRGIPDEEISRVEDTVPTPALGLAFVQLNTQRGAKLVPRSLYYQD